MCINAKKTHFLFESLFIFSSYSVIRLKEHRNIGTYAAEGGGRGRLEKYDIVLGDTGDVSRVWFGFRFEKQYKMVGSFTKCFSAFSVSLNDAPLFL